MKKIFENIKSLFLILLGNKILRKPDFSEKKIFLTGKIISDRNKNKIKLKSLKDVEFSVFSQFGEDGIIDWLINKIPNIEKVFLEIGTQDYWESNTRFLLKNNNWKGYLFEASKSDILKIKSQRIYWQHNVKAFQAFVDRENINELINNNIKEKNIGLLSIDIDGNDYWVIEQISKLSPTIIICEYNSIFGDVHKLSIPYESKFSRNEKSNLNLYFGCSINAIVSLMEKKNYSFIGTGSSGVNAFFVKNEFKDLIKNDIQNNAEIFPSIARESRNSKGELTYENIFENLKKIQDFDVFDFELNKIKKLSEYKDLYSDNWKKYF